MAINLATKFETKLDNRFVKNSLTEAACGNQYTFDGVNAIKVWTLNNPTINDYNASASQFRYGQVTEVQDEINTYQLIGKKSFASSFDETNVQDQMFVKKATVYLKQVWDEVFVPMIDKYRLEKWANGAGQGGYSSTALTKSNVVEALLTANAALDDAGVPREGRFIFIKSDVAIKYKIADEFKTADGIMAKYVIKGQIGAVEDVPLISVPAKRMPAGVAFIVKYKQASADPMKLKKLKATVDPVGFAGTVMEGLVRYDSFVLANKADGIYVYATDAAKVAQNVAFTLSDTSLTLATATASGVIKYTKDGTNPKTNAEALTYSASITVASGDHIRAYASKSGLLNSAITEYTVE